MLATETLFLTPITMSETSKNLFDAFASRGKAGRGKCDVAAPPMSSTVDIGKYNSAEASWLPAVISGSCRILVLRDKVSRHTIQGFTAADGSALLT